MTRREFEIRRTKCEQKTTSGNVYPSRTLAIQVARRFRFHRGRKVQAFLCPVCQQFHVGREYPKRMWA